MHAGPKTFGTGLQTPSRPFGVKLSPRPGTTRAILADIESAAAKPGAAAASRDQARAAFLDCRRDAGENHYPAGRLALALTGHLKAGDPAAARSLLRQTAADPTLPDEARAFIQALDAIATGNRDPALAEAPGLTYDMAAEVQLLLETLA